MKIIGVGSLKENHKIWWHIFSLSHFYIFCYLRKCHITLRKKRKRGNVLFCKENAYLIDICIKMSTIYLVQFAFKTQVQSAKIFAFHLIHGELPAHNLNWYTITNSTQYVCRLHCGTTLTKDLSACTYIQISLSYHL